MVIPLVSVNEASLYHYMDTEIIVLLPALKKDSYKREGKGRRCFLEDRIVSIPCRASFFALGRFEGIG